MKSDNPERDAFEGGGEAAELASQDVTEDQPDGAGEGEEEEEEGPARTTDGSSVASAELEELQSLRDRYLRLAAEYENFRKRTDRERIEARDRAQGQIVERLLEPLDDLQRVAQFNMETTTVESILEGIRMVERKFARVLESAGLEALNASGEEFDPELHEALMMTPTDDAGEDHTVGEVFQKGYRFRGGLLRPARVQVRKFEG